MTENERIKNAFQEIFDNYDCLYELSDLEALPHDVQLHIADVYYKRPFDENDERTYDISRELNREIFKAININDFKKIIGTDKLSQNGIEITDIKTKNPIGNDFFFAESNMSDNDVQNSFGEVIQEISFRNSSDENVTFTSYTDLKKALDNPDNSFFHNAEPIPNENTPVRKFSSAGAEKLREMTENSDMYIDFLKFQGRVFKHSASVALEFFTQRPETKFIATREQWAKSNRTVAQGSEAIRFVDSDGKNTDFYDFSQVEGTNPPYQWTINKSNANAIKSQLGIPEKMPIISGVINSTVKPSHITSCMSALGIPPKNYKEFSKSYINAIQLVIAGRLEIGGSNFNIPSDLTALKMLKTESQKLAFLTHAANTARESLMKIERTVQNINTMERIEKNDLREMENSDFNRTEERSGRGTPDNTAGITGEQSDRSESNESGRSTGLGDDSESPERKEHEMVSGVQNENGGQSGVLVQVRPNMRTLQPESDGVRTVDGGRTDRNLRAEMDDVHGGELSASGGGNEAVSQVSDSNPLGGEESTGVQGLAGRPVRTDESTSDRLRGSAEMGTGEDVLLGQHSDEGSSLSSGDGSIEEKLNSVFSSEETEKTSTEKADVFVLDDKERLVQITAKIGEKEKVFTDLANAEEKDYNLISDVVKEIQELKKVQAELKEKIQAEPLTEKDVEILLEIKPSKKPVQNMTETEVAKTTKFESMLDKEMGGKSPYAMRKKGGNDWRNDESKKVRISEVQPHSTSRPEIMADYRDPDNLLLKDSKYLNPDTGATIFLDKDGISETIAKAMVDKKHSKPYKAPLAALYHIEDLIENSICFDSQISKYDKNTAKNKSPNTMFMHRFYGVIKYNDDFYLTNMAIEETYKSKDNTEIDSTKNHLYSLRGIKITPIGNLGLIPRSSSSTDESGSPSSVTEISIPQLYRFVKAFDTNFFENPNSVGREARETELFLQAEYADAVNEDENQTETKEQIVEFAKSHNITVHKAKKELEQAVERYDGFIADEKKNKGFSEERNHELEMCIHKSFEKIREINNFTEEQLNFINNLEKFSITNHVINNMINSAFEKSNRFSSLYVSENWVNSSIFTGYLSELKKALNEEIKAQIELLKQEKAQKSLTEKEKKSVSEITEMDLTDGIENAPQIQIASSDWTIDMENTPQIIFLETDNPDGKFHFNETIFTYNIENVTVEVQESSDNLYDFDNQETLSVEDGAERISELLERYSEKNIHISLVYENGESESLMQYINHASGDYPMIESFFNNSVPEFANPKPDDRKAPKSKIYTVEEYNNLLAKASDNIQEGQSFKLHFKVILSDRRSYSETFELTKNTGKLSEILNSSENKSKSDRNFLKALKMISEKEKSPEISEIKADSDDNSKRSKNGDIIIGNTTFRYIPQKTYTKIDKETAVKVAEQLENQGIKFSGVIKGDTATITVSKPQKEILDSIIANISSSENVDSNNDNFNENAVKYAFGRIMEEHKYDFTNPTFMYLGHLQNYMIEHKIDDIVIGATSETLRKHYGNALLTEEYFSPDYTFSRDLPKEYTTYFQEYISMENVKSEREKQALISVEIFGEKYYFKINENSIDDILKTANAEKPLLEFMKIGEKVSEYEYAKIQQSDSFAYSIEMNLDNDTASIYMVNNGKGGISEADRTDSNVTFDTVRISDYSNQTDTTVDDLSVGDIILYDGKRREVEQINEKQISLKNLDAPDFGGILLGTSDVYAYDGWREDMNTKGFEIISKAEPEITLNVDEKIYQVVTYSNNSGADDKEKYATIDEAIEDGRQYLHDGYDGFAILNTEENKVELYEGEFPLEGIFSEQVYKNSGTWFTAKPLPNNIKEELEKNIDKFYINKENESVTWVYFNPDSDSGGQLVYNTFDFDTLKSAVKSSDMMNYLYENGNITLCDVTDDDFIDSAMEFLQPDEDFNSTGLSDTEVEKKLSMIIENQKVYHVVTYSHDSGDDNSGDYANIAEAIDAGRKYLENGDDGYAILNTAEHRIELYGGDFPREGIFSEEVYEKSESYVPTSNNSNPEKLYRRFAKMFPDIVSGEHIHERYGNVGDAYEPLTVEHLGGNTYAFMTYFIQNGDVMRDPDFEFELDHENKTLNILEYQQDGSVFGTIYQRVYDENNNPDLKLLSALEKNLMQNLKNAHNMERPLTSYTDKDGNEFNSDNEPETIEPEESETNDKSPELRAVLNEFSEKYGLGELNVEPSNYNGYNWKLTEKFQDGTDSVLGEIDSPEYGKPFTSEELRTSLEKFESEIQSRGQDISELYNRKSDSANHGGISELPKVQKELPEITYASRPSEKISNNISAIREMIRLENAEKSGEELYDKRSNQYNSKQNSEYRLRQYCGWGGLSQVFDERFKQYDYRRQELQSLLAPEEYAEAKASSLNAHYTPQIIIDAMYKAVKNMDLPRDARILEPACGTGNFISRLPHSFSDAEVTGVELDNITARIAKQINRDNEKVQIINSGFENSCLANNSFDLAIGNVPFGDYNMNDPDYVQDWKIHDAFFRKALDKVASGGVVAFVTSTGTMDKANPKIREYLATQADLIGAVRLPNNAFSDAGTGVPSDIIFLKKRENPLQAHEPKPDWCYTIPDKNGLKINSYFVQNPQMILGEMKKTTFQDRLTCEPFEGADLEKQLNEAIKNLNAKITVAKREKAVNEQRGNIEPWGKNFTFQIKDDKVYYRNRNKMEEIKCTPTEKEMIKELCEIRDVTRKLIDLQKTSMRDEELVPVRESLNKLYDEYRAEHGELSDKSVKRLFGSDSDYPILQSLENYNKESEKVEKADIFFRRTVNSMLEINLVESVEEALQVSLDQKGKPDISYMAILLDKSPESVCNELLEKGQIFIDPEKELPDKPFSGVVERSEYLSGNVRMKLTIAEEYAKSNPEYKQNVDALKTVIPEDIKAEEISVQMGCAWIDPEDYTAFLEHLSGRTNYNARSCDVSYSPATGEFDVLHAGSKKDLNLNETTTYGTADLNMYQLAEKILNQRRIAVKREKINPKDPTKTVTRTDPKATKIALEKAKLIRAEFEKWIFADDKRKAKYERKYNDIFNSIVGRDYDGSHLTFSGIANDFTLRPHQKNCVARAIYGGNTLAAHVVGAGKSAVIFTSVMKKKELGLINKACVVVPKALTEQTANEWRKVYPDAKILTVTNEDLSNETKRNLFTAKVATGSYDAVILSQEQFEKIPMSKQYRINFMQKELDSLEDMLREKKLENQGKKDYSVKAIERAKKQLESKLNKLIDPKSASKAKDDLLEFEQLGFDYLVCDEAHAYKNGFVQTKMTNVAGVTTKPSGRAEDMQMKTDYFNEQLGQGHILFATGTPVSNSMTELYVMTRYLRPDLLKQAGVERFDDWAATFGNVVTKNQQTADGTLKMKTSFASFANLPELMAMYKEFADVQSAEKLNLPRPELKMGKPQIISIPATPEQKMYVSELAERAKAIEDGLVDPHEDNHLKLTSEARLIGLGNNAVKALYEKRGEELPYDFVDDKNSKVDKCVEKVAELYEKTNDTKGVQIIFSDVAVNSDNGNFSVYDYIKDELVAKGIPEDEIIFAPKSDSKERENIFRDINNSKYRVVIASTGTLGTGANIQQNLYALHHIDVPWKPSDFEQREGRILRQGNKNKEVEIFNYVTEGTLDSYLYQTVTNKARFIAQLLDNKTPARVSEDCDEKVLTYGEIQAAAEGNPDFKRRIEVSNEIAELAMLKSSYDHETAITREKIETIPEEIRLKKEMLSHVQNDRKSAEKIQEIALKNKNAVVMTKEKVNEYLLKMAQEKLTNTEKEILPVNINNFKVAVYFDKQNNEVRFSVQGESMYSCTAGTAENQDNYQRLQNIFEKAIPKKEQEIIKEISALEENLEQAKIRVETPFSHEKELEEKVEEFQKLEEKLSGLSVQEDVVIDPEEEPIIETAEEKSARESIYNVDENDYQPTENDDNPNTFRR